MAVKVVARFAMRIVVVLLWVLLFPALLVNPAVAMVLGSLAHGSSVGRPDEQLSLGTYLIMWAVSGGVLVLFAATAFRRERQWSQWTDQDLQRLDPAG